MKHIIFSNFLTYIIHINYLENNFLFDV